MALCYPNTVIWPVPSVIEPPDDATPEQVELLELQVELALGYAWTTLQALTAYQIAICPITVRPCGQGCGGGSYFIAPVSGPAGAPFWPYLINGQMVNILHGCGENPCGHSWTRDVVLPGPIGEVVEVVVDGVTLDSDDYRVDDGYRLVRQDGEGWPLSQDFNLPAGEVGTWSVTYYHGSTADQLVQFAAGLLATEYLKAVQGDGDCALPPGTVQLIRQGVTMEIEKDMFEGGLTGIRLVDDLTARYNPYRLKTPPMIYSLDRPQGRQTTWSYEGS